MGSVQEKHSALYSAADGWTLYYGFRANGGTAINLTSTPDGAGHSIEQTAAETEQWIPGDYKGVAQVRSTTETRTIWKGGLTILPNLLVQDANYDARTHNRKCLDAINAVLEGKATRDILNTTISGQTIQRMSWSELTSAKAHYQDLVDGETAAENADNGQGSGRNVLIRFTRP